VTSDAFWTDQPKLLFWEIRGTYGCKCSLTHYETPALQRNRPRPVPGPRAAQKFPRRRGISRRRAGKARSGSRWGRKRRSRNLRQPHQYHRRLRPHREPDSRQVPDDERSPPNPTTDPATHQTAARPAEISQRRASQRAAGGACRLSSFTQLRRVHRVHRGHRTPRVNQVRQRRAAPRQRRTSRAAPTVTTSSASGRGSSSSARARRRSNVLR